MRLLIVSNFFPPYNVGGAEIVADRHAAEMKRRGHHVAVLGGSPPSEDRGPGCLLVEDAGDIIVYRTAVRSLDPSRSFFWGGSARILEAVIRHEKPDVVHFHNLVGLGVNLIPRVKSLGIPCVLTLHDYWGFCLRQTRLTVAGALCKDMDECHACLSHITIESGVAMPTRLRRDYIAWCIGLADRIVSPSRALAEAYSKAGISRIKVRSNGIDVGRFQQRPPRSGDCVRFVFIGYFGEHKGVKILIDAIKRLARRPDLNGKWTMSLVGDGQLKEWIASEIERLDNSAIRLLGKVPQSEIPNLLSDHDVLVMPSVWPENEPVVLLESIAVGIAQIATAHGGNVDLVHDQKGGFLVAPGDAEALASTMRVYALSPTTARDHGAYNARRRSDISEHSSCEGYEADYRDIAREANAGTQSRELVVICGTGWPTLETTRLVNNLALLENGDTRLRLLSAEWADAYVWPRTSLLWIWSAEGDEELIRRATRYGIPILIQRDHSSSAWLRENAAAVVYGTLLEAATVLCELVEPVSDRNRGGTEQRDGDLLAMMSKPSSYSLIVASPRHV